MIQIPVNKIDLNVDTRWVRADSIRANVPRLIEFSRAFITGLREIKTGLRARCRHARE